MKNSVSFSLSDELMTSLNIEAYTSDETKAATVRRILKKHFVELGLFSPREPTTHQKYMTNPLFVSRQDLNNE